MGSQATNCINCGAPLNLKRETCEYCSTAIIAEPVAMDWGRGRSYQAIRIPGPSSDMYDAFRYAGLGMGQQTPFIRSTPRRHRFWDALLGGAAEVGSKMIGW